jgi:3-hydroxyisobutyrate dehydrogenase-like beta-hydroxyacid dehydrogenase
LAVTDLKEFNDCQIVVLSLPTTNEVKAVCEKLDLPEGAIIIDTTSGDPNKTKEVSAKL